MTIFALLFFAALLCCDLPALLRKGDRRELLAYALVSGVTLVYLMQFAMGAEIFSPIKALSEFVGHTLGLSYELWQGHA